MSMSDEELQEAYDACKTDAEREAVIRKVGEEFADEGGNRTMDAETLELILSFCDIAVQTTLMTLAQGLTHPASNVKALDAEMMVRLAKNPPPVVRDAVFGMIDMMGLTVGDPDADPEMTDAALTAILNGEA
jgi:hypothetical protein